MRLIDADALITELHQTADIGGELGDIVQVVKDYAVSMVKKQPTYEERKQKWVVYEVGTDDKPIAWECPNCGEVVDHKYNFCPNCGADMR